MNKYKYITIEGNIGAGKTTLSKMIADEFNAKLILEQFADNPFLPKFYNDPERYSFPLELSFLAARYKQLNSEIQDTDLFKSFTIADYYFAKSLIFAKSTLPNDEYNLYRQLFDIIYQQLLFPDIYVFLHVNIDRLLENIQLRGRDYERDIKGEYLKEIQDSYFSFFKTVTDFPVVVVDCSSLDFVQKPNEYAAIKNLIFNEQYKKGMNTVIL